MSFTAQIGPLLRPVLQRRIGPLLRPALQRRGLHHQSVEHVRGTRPWILTCEHASSDLPPGYSWGNSSAKDTGTAALAQSHWAFDPGARDLTLERAAASGAPAVLSRWSRLFCDVNRPLASVTLMRELCDGRSVALNAEMGSAERQRRIHESWVPSHVALGEVTNGLGPGGVLVVSLHSFNPVCKWTATSNESAPLRRAERPL